MQSLQCAHARHVRPLDELPQHALEVRLVRFTLVSTTVAMMSACMCWRARGIRDDGQLIIGMARSPCRQSAVTHVANDRGRAAPLEKSCHDHDGSTLAGVERRTVTSCAGTRPRRLETASCDVRSSAYKAVLSRLAERGPYRTAWPTPCRASLSHRHRLHWNHCHCCVPEYGTVTLCCPCLVARARTWFVDSLEGT